MVPNLIGLPLDLSAYAFLGIIKLFSYEVHCYCISMIAEAQKQLQVTRRTATIMTFATTPPEAQLY